MKKIILLSILGLVSTSSFAADRITLSPGSTTKLEVNKETIVTCEAEGGLPSCSIQISQSGYYQVKMSDGFEDKDVYNTLKGSVDKMKEFKEAGLCK